MFEKNDRPGRPRKDLNHRSRMDQQNRPQIPQVIVEEIKKFDCIVPFDLGNVPRSVSKHHQIHKGLGVLNNEIGALIKKGFNSMVVTFTVSRLLKTCELNLPEWVNYHKDGCAMLEATNKLEEEAIKVQKLFIGIEKNFGEMAAIFCIDKGKDETEEYIKRRKRLQQQGYQRGIVEVAALTHNSSWAADQLEQYARHNGFLSLKPDELALRIFDGCREKYYEDYLNS